MSPSPPGQSFFDLQAPPQASEHPLLKTTWEIGSSVAAKHADDVDQNARFPSEAVDALREARLLSLLVPKESGGAGADIGVAAAVVRSLAMHCSATALVFAMHSIEVVGLCRFGTTPALRTFLADLVADQLLIANANSEVGVGSAPGRSICALESGSDDRWSLDKQALAISYGAYADAAVVTARRTADSPPGDQILALARRPDIELTPLSGWDTLGLRGTCSNSFRLQASGPNDAIFPASFPQIAAGGLLLAGQILLSSAWVGLTEAAVARVHGTVRKQARKNIGVLPPAAPHLADLVINLQQARSLLACAVANFDAVAADEERLEDPAQLIGARNLKIATSTIAADVATKALSICGIAAFRRDSDISMDRLIRDSHGGLIMVSNESNRRLNAEALTARRSI